MIKLEKDVYEIKIIDKEYPKKLREIKGMPQVIYAKGNIELLNNNGIGIDIDLDFENNTCSRDCDEYGIKHTKIFADYLSKKGITIISGLAKGIDSIAHIYSMKNKGKTIAVLPCGFNNIYPKENINLVNAVVENGGLLISEWSLNVKADIYRFPQRNRIISGLSIGVLVVESKLKSGSNITAHNAMKQGRSVFAIPGDMDNERSKGTNMLIKEGAYPVSEPMDIIDILEFEGYIFNKK